MKSNKLKVQINKSNQAVYDFYIDPKNTPLWVESIILEQTNEWPIKIGTIYKNQNRAREWSEYTVSDLEENKIFELTSKNGNYHVRYTHHPSRDDNAEIEYFEWVDTGELDSPFTQDDLLKLKNKVEENDR